MKNLVLTFHNVTDTKWFERTIQIISRFYHFGSLNDLNQRLRTGQGATPMQMCFLTFDDGEKSVYQNVYPIIKRTGTPIAVFVSPENIRNGGSFWFQRIRLLDESRVESMKTLCLSDINKCINDLDPQHKSDIDSNINIDMFREMQQSGLVTFGAHTQNHPILANENNKVAEYEIKQSISELRTLLRSDVDFFAFPNGTMNDFIQRDVEYLKEMNIKLAFTMNNAFADDSDYFRVNRVGISNGGKFQIIAKILFPRLYVWLKHIIKS